MKGFPSADLIPHAPAQHFFGAELRYYRLRAGLSQRQLAPLVLVEATTIGKVEMAQRYPTLDFAERCDSVLGCDGALVRLHDLVCSERVMTSAGPGAVTAEMLVRLLESVASIVASTGSGPSRGAQTSAVLASIDAALVSAKPPDALRPKRHNQQR